MYIGKYAFYKGALSLNVEAKKWRNSDKCFPNRGTPVTSLSWKCKQQVDLPLVDIFSKTLICKWIFGWTVFVDCYWRGWQVVKIWGWWKLREWWSNIKGENPPRTTDTWPSGRRAFCWIDAWNLSSMTLSLSTRSKPEEEKIHRFFYLIILNNSILNI